MSDPRIYDCARILEAIGDQSSKEIEIARQLSRKYDPKSEKLNILSEISFIDQVIVVLFFCSVVIGAVLPFMLIGFALFWNSPLDSPFTTLICLGIAITIARYPLEFPEKPIGTFSVIGRALIRYFSMKVITEAPILPDKQYIFIAPPHGYLPIGNLLMMLFSRTMGFTLKGLLASSMLHLPVVRNLLTMVGCVDAGKSSALKTLSKGNNLGISSGGIAEMFENHPLSKCETILIKRRKGFVKLALESGASIVPTYVFGNTSAMSVVADPWGILQSISRKIGLALAIAYGRFGTPVPHRSPICLVLGKPIEVKKNLNASDEEIERIHGEVLEALSKMFEEYKVQYGWGFKQLKIK
jgi:1-acyl-sn-glycerol-3-phosphate acyltransferase